MPEQRLREAASHPSSETGEARVEGLVDRLTRVSDVLGRMESLEVAAGPLPPDLPPREDYPRQMADLISEAMNIIGDPRSLAPQIKVCQNVEAPNE